MATLLYEQFIPSHVDHLTPQHTAVEQSAARLSVVLELLPGLILFDFINLTQVHNFTVSAQDVLPSVDFRYLPQVLQEFCKY